LTIRKFIDDTYFWRISNLLYEESDLFVSVNKVESDDDVTMLSPEKEYEFASIDSHTNKYRKARNDRAISIFIRLGKQYSYYQRE